MCALDAGQRLKPETITPASKATHPLIQRPSSAVGADLRYSGLMTKNPLNPWPNCTAQWFRRAPYTLSELREWLPDEILKPAYTTGVGRNEDLFRHCVKLAHQPKWAPDHPDPGLRRPLAGTRPCAEHPVLRREPAPRRRVPLHRQELRRL